MTLIRRTPSTVLQAVGDELLVHDTARDETFALAGASAEALQAVEGETDIETLVDAHGASAVAELVENELVEADGFDRRDLLKRAGIVGAVVGSGALVSLVAAPAAFALTSTSTATITPANSTSTSTPTSKSYSLAFPTNSPGTVTFAVTPPAGGSATIAKPSQMVTATATSAGSSITFTGVGVYMITGTITSGSNSASSTTTFTIA